MSKSINQFIKIIFIFKYNYGRFYLVSEKMAGKDLFVKCCSGIKRSLVKFSPPSFEF